MKKCKYCGTTENLRKDYYRTYNECFSCLEKRQDEQVSFIKNEFKKLNYTISTKDELILFLKENLKIICTLSGRQMKSLYRYIEEFNNNQFFNVQKCINFLCYKINKPRASSFEKLYIIINELKEIPKDNLGYEKKFNNSKFCYEIYYPNERKNIWIEYNKRNQNKIIKKTIIYTLEELKKQLFKDKILIKKNGKIYIQNGFQGNFYHSEKFEYIRYSIWYYTQFLDNTVEVRERLYCILNDIKEQPKCKFCKKKLTQFLSIDEGYRIYCSTKCNRNDPEFKKDIEEIFLERFGYKSGFERINQENLIDWESSQAKRLDTISKWTEEQRQEFLDNISKGVLKAHVEHGEEIKAKSLATKIKNGTLYGHKGQGFDKKGQDLFWFLDDNLNNYTPIYATYKSRDIDGKRNDEYFINVIGISKTNYLRKLDFYLKLNNEKEICIEFDPNGHKGQIKEDLIREQEILQARKNLIILRVQEDYYLQNKEKVQNDLLNLILLIDKTGRFNYNIVDKNYLPLHVKESFDKVV